MRATGDCCLSYASATADLVSIIIAGLHISVLSSTSGGSFIRVLDVVVVKKLSAHVLSPKGLGLQSCELCSRC